MAEFKLCEEMGLKTCLSSNQYVPGDFVILASDVEKMLQGGSRGKKLLYTIKEVGGFSSQVTDFYSDEEQITISIPKKPKPVSKAEILDGLRYIAICGEESKAKKQELIERIEKAGIE